MNSSIGGIAPLWGELRVSTDGKTKLASAESGLFEDVFSAAIDAVKETDSEKNQAEYLMATGQLDNPALLTIASTKAQLSVDLLVQLRNKAVEAYSELMRISL